ncbi:MAG TPA: HIT family protein [Candidatus Saccharimonadia bacterium]|nr:HIT family protein [Candidatus Saccharimonadia bacterium]
MIEDSIFTKIIKGEIPCHKVYEDKTTIAIIPLHPIAIAEVLVIPKKQIDRFFELPDKDYQDLMTVVKKVAARMQKVFNTKRVGLQTIGLHIAHCHIHVVAFNTYEEYLEVADESLSVDHERLAKIARKLAF